MDTLLKMEGYLSPTTQSMSEYEEMRDKFLAEYRAASRPVLSRTFAAAVTGTHEDVLREALLSLEKIGLHFNSLTELEDRLNPSDDFQEELRIMAEVRAYFQISYKVC